MKARTLLFAFAATMMLFVACDKDEDTNNVSTRAGSYLVYNGTNYTFNNVYVDYYHDELTLVSAETNDTLDNGEPKLSIAGIHITPNAWNKTLDLANASQWPEDVMVALHLSGELNITFEASNNAGVMGSWGEFEGEEIVNTSIFTSGTYRVSGNNDGTPITITYDGVLKNGKNIQIKIVTDNYDINK